MNKDQEEKFNMLDSLLDDEQACVVDATSDLVLMWIHLHNSSDEILDLIYSIEAVLVRMYRMLEYQRDPDNFDYSRELINKFRTEVKRSARLKEEEFKKKYK